MFGMGCEAIHPSSPYLLSELMVRETLTGWSSSLWKYLFRFRIGERVELELVEVTSQGGLGLG